MKVLAGLPPATLEQIRARLEAEQAALAQRLGSLAERADQTTATHGQGETEHVQIDVERALTSSLEQAARDALDDIALALAGLDDGSYGSCSVCGDPIPLPRLEAVPTTRRCVRCQQHRERRW